jgi:hypothetical protein
MSDPTHNPPTDKNPNQHQGAQNQPRQPALSVGAALAIGIGVGTSFGVAMDNVALGVGLGAALGIVIGSGFALLNRRPPGGK